MSSSYPNKYPQIFFTSQTKPHTQTQGFYVKTEADFRNPHTTGRFAPSFKPFPLLCHSLLLPYHTTQTVSDHAISHLTISQRKKNGQRSRKLIRCFHSWLTNCDTRAAALCVCGVCACARACVRTLLCFSTPTAQPPAVQQRGRGAAAPHTPCVCARKHPPRRRALSTNRRPAPRLQCVPPPRPHLPRLLAGGAEGERRGGWTVSWDSTRGRPALKPCPPLQKLLHFPVGSFIPFMPIGRFNGRSRAFFVFCVA
jgi:hypothetical protein